MVAEQTKKHTTMENTQTETKKGMTKEQILGTIKSLAMSQGLYGRLLRDIHNNPEILDRLEEQNFQEPLDLVLFIEC